MKRSLNCCYRLIWSEVHQAYIVVSELSKSYGKRASGVVLAGSIATFASMITIHPADAATTDVNNGQTVNGTAVGASDILNINSGGRRRILVLRDRVYPVLVTRAG